MEQEQSLKERKKTLEHLANKNSKQLNEKFESISVILENRQVSSTIKNVFL